MVNDDRIRVGVNGYGVVGKRVAGVVRLQKASRLNPLRKRVSRW